jgi:hypothetical protein
VVSSWTSQYLFPALPHLVSSPRRASLWAAVRPCRRCVSGDHIRAALPPSHSPWSTESFPHTHTFQFAANHRIGAWSVSSSHWWCHHIDQSNCLTWTLPRWQLTWPWPLCQWQRVGTLLVQIVSLSIRNSRKS